MPMTKGEAPTPEGSGQNHISYTRSRMSSPVLTSAIRNTVNQVRVVGRDEDAHAQNAEDVESSETPENAAEKLLALFLRCSRGQV